MEKIIEYFTKRHFLTNFIVVAVIVGGFFSWQYTKKEELPDVTFDRARIQVRYPGATAEDVEYFVTKPIEEALRGVDGIYRITSTSSVGSCSIMVELQRDYGDPDDILTEIRNEVFEVQLPEEITDDPDIRIFKTSKKAIIDIALIHTKIHLLDMKTRQQLQQYALTLEDQLLNLSAVNSVTRQGYLQPEIQIKVDPEKMAENEVPFNTAMREIKNSHIRKPAGSLETQSEPKVTLLSEVNTVDKLKSLVIQGGFEGGVTRLEEVAEVSEGFEKNEMIIKVNGHEAIMFNVVKNSAYGILEALRAVNRVVLQFKKNQLAGTDIQIIFLDDESTDIRNRLSIIAINGGIGFILVLATLFIFLNKRSGVWVAMGIPFTLCFTMICGSLLGFTINGTTLAAVILVMGMIVDDAIVVAENITRQLQRGVPRHIATVQGTSYVLFPVMASILTTCIAFVPLYFFEGRFGAFIKFIPPVIFIILGASLFESIFILPGHMTWQHPFGDRFKRKKTSPEDETQKGHWFEAVERKYGQLLQKVIPYKGLILGAFAFLLLVSLVIFKTQMKFVMFPHEETQEIMLNGTAPAGTKRFETAELSRKVEDIIIPRIGGEVVGFRTEIAKSRRGGAVEENKFRTVIEIVSKEKRKRSADQIVRGLEEEVQKLEGFEEIKFSKSRWGQASGSPIELFVQENDDRMRAEAVRLLVERMEAHPALKNVEVDEGYQIPEYRLTFDQEKVKRMSIDPEDIASTLRAALEGSVLYEFSDGDEDVAVRLTTVDEAKDDISKLLGIHVENQKDYLVRLREIIRVEEIQSPNAIFRQDLKRTTIIDADLEKEAGLTPLEVAEDLEERIFPEVLSQYPTTTLSFGGEVRDTRESTRDFINAIIAVIFLIYAVLAVMFHSLLRPLVIMLVIPFGVVGIILAFWLHGKTLFGFYAAVGALGLAGVVINDSIIMLVKLDKEYEQSESGIHCYHQIADIAKTRLRAVVLTTLTTIAGLLPTAYGFAGYDTMLGEMMLALTWGLGFGTLITLFLVPCVYAVEKDLLKRRPAQSKPVSGGPPV